MTGLSFIIKGYCSKALAISYKCSIFCSAVHRGHSLFGGENYISSSAVKKSVFFTARDEIYICQTR